MVDPITAYGRHLTLEGYPSATVAQYLSDAGVFLRSLGKEVTACGVDDVRAFLAQSNEKCSRRWEKATRARKLAALRNFFRFLEAQGFIGEDPCAGIKAAKVPLKEQNCLSEEEVEMLKKVWERDGSLRGQKNRCMFALLYYLGLRVSELARIDLNHLSNGSPPNLTIQGKGNKIRILPIENDYLSSAIKPWLAFRKKTRMPTEALFVNLATKRRLSVRTVQRRLARLGRDTGLGIPISPHVLRRSFATNLLNQEVDVIIIASLLGHARLDVTRRYALVSPKLRKEALNRLR